ncbi:unnamed protein product [Ectocarpus sp. CCAP 1310/34]|nr:unnamed protein product [Ectocarpus sp. CCAP 1310/34]
MAVVTRWNAWRPLWTSSLVHKISPASQIHYVLFEHIFGDYLWATSPKKTLKQLKYRFFAHDISLDLCAADPVCAMHCLENRSIDDGPLSDIPENVNRLKQNAPRMLRMSLQSLGFAKAENYRMMNYSPMKTRLRRCFKYAHDPETVAKNMSEFGLPKTTANSTGDSSGCHGQEGAGHKRRWRAGLQFAKIIMLVRGEGKANSVSDARSRKIKLDPTPEWKERLRKWMGTARWTYNRCLDFLNRKKCRMNKTNFRRKVVGGWNHGDAKKRTGKKKKKRGKNRGNWSKPKKTSKRDCKTSWVLETPFEIRDSAMVDLYDGIVTNLKKREKNPTHTFSMTFRALDPGVRTFNTAVDSKGNVTEFASGDVTRIYRLCHHMDKLQSKAFNKATPSRKRYNLRKAWQRAIKRVKDLVMDVRNKTVKHLCKNCDLIFLPQLNTKELVT